jgi:cytochrome oxidase Cu insertion factor (SCO1/SenC/PrrC family)
MTRRRSLLLAVAIVFAILFGALLEAWPAMDEPSRHAARSPAAGPYRGSEAPAAIRIPKLALRDVVDRRIVRTEGLRGGVVLVTFLDTDCTEQCPIIASQIGRALALLGDDEQSRTAALAISVNPEIDTRSSVVRFLRRHRVLGDVRYLSGSIAQLRPVWEAFQIVSAYETGDADIHSAGVRLFDPRGRWVATLHAGVDLTPANLAHDIATAFSSGG